MNFGFVIDNRKCIGCHACTVACKSEHQVPVGVNRTWVKYIEKGEFPDTRRLFSVMRCNHCADAPCVEICPVTALYTREDGIVDFDNRRCIGCKACTQACPYDALFMEPENHTASKCNYCTHRVDIGLEPACVVVCPEHAIVSGDMDNPDTEISRLLARETVSARKPEKGTNPKLFYIDGDRVSLNPSATEVESDYMWSSQATGVGHFAKFAEERIATGAQSTGAQASPLAVSAEARRDSGARRVYDAPNKGVLWGWEVSAYVLTKAIATGAFMIPVIASYFMFVPPEIKRLSVAVAFSFLCVTGVLLILDLGRPDRFLNVIFRPQWRSWLSRGAYFITVYGGLLTGWIVADWFEFETILKYLEPVAIVFAVLTAVYTAFLFAQAKGRDFWQSPMLGLHMILHSLMAGIGVALLITYWMPAKVALMMVLGFFVIASIAFHLVTLAIELLTTHPTADAHATVKSIVKGEFARPFWVGMIFTGNVLPIALILTGNPLLYALAGALMLVGLWFAEDIWVKAPQRIQLS